MEYATLGVYFPSCLRGDLYVFTYVGVIYIYSYFHLSFILISVIYVDDLEINIRIYYLEKFPFKLLTNIAWTFS